MLALLIGGVLWMALDVALLGLWVAVGQRRRRQQARR
jgi:hypothetical protein